MKSLLFMLVFAAATSLHAEKPAKMVETSASLGVDGNQFSALRVTTRPGLAASFDTGKLKCKNDEYRLRVETVSAVKGSEIEYSLKFTISRPNKKPFAFSSNGTTRSGDPLVYSFEDGGKKYDVNVSLKTRG
jgi:hypothetical protein